MRTYGGGSAVELKTQVPSRMNTVVDKEVYLAELREETREPSPTRALDVLPAAFGHRGRRLGPQSSLE
jgi:hypothetical protein